MAARNEQASNTTSSIAINQANLDDSQPVDADLSSLLDFDEDHGVKPISEKSNGEPKKRIRTSKRSPFSKVKDKNAIDLDKQCGVLCADGTLCPRIITCKAHTVAMKKAVSGRSMGYYQLVQIHQASNSRSRKKTGMQSNPVKAASKSDVAIVGTEVLPEESGQDEHSSDCDLDAEAEAVVLALRSYACHPIATYTPPFVTRKYRISRLLLMQNPSYLDGGFHSLN